MATFIASHPFELSTLEDALEHYIDAGRDSSLGVARHLLGNVRRERVAAELEDRQNQYAGGRAAND